MRSTLLLFCAYCTIIALHVHGQAKSTASVDTPFVQAQNLILDERFDNTPLGKLPASWRMVRRDPQPTDSCRLAENNGYRALVLVQGNIAGFEPVMYSTSYLNNSFTIEYDYFQDEKKCSTGCATSIVLRDTLKNRLEISFYLFGRLDFRCASDGGIFQEKKVYADFSKTLHNYDRSIWHHIAISFHNKNIRCYIDGAQVLSTNACIQPASFVLDGRSVFGVRNVKVALNGSTGIFDRIQTENKFITHSILFDVNKSVIKPESMPFIAQLARWLKKHPDVRLEISGHTDSDGIPEANMDLSSSRAASVKEQLAALGVTNERLTTKGFGATKPIADNATEQGKASNRRVEFIKL